MSLDNELDLKKEYTCNVETLAALLNLDPRRIQQLAKEGIIKKEERGLYHVFESITNYINFIKGNQEDETKPNISHERALLARSKRVAQDMENDKRRGELVELAEAQEFNKAMALLYIQALECLESRLTNDLAGVTQSDPSTIRSIIRKEVRLIREETADKLLNFSPQA